MPRLLGMRWWWVASLLLGCASGDPIAGTAASEDAGARSREADSDVNPERATHLCFRIDDASGLSDLVPTIRPTLSVVAHRWRWPILIDDSCESVVRVAAVPRASGPARTFHDGRGVLYGGATTIELDRAYLEQDRLIDTNEHGCASGAPAWLLSRVLAHELGHALLRRGNAAHSDEPSSVMAPASVAEPCVDAFPTAEEIAAADSGAN